MADKVVSMDLLQMRYDSYKEDQLMMPIWARGVPSQPFVVVSMTLDWICDLLSFQ